MEILNKIKQVENSIKELKECALSGEIQEHKALAEIKVAHLEDTLKSTISEIQDVALTSIRNLLEGNEKTLKDGSFKYIVRQGSTRYYFKDVKEVQEAKKEYESSDVYKKFKATENKYKTAFILSQKQQSIVDEETGELIDPSSVNVVYAKDSISIKPL